ncbi:4354_t:CDS:2 [Ambispora gerdemannii]|uniref:4354_t:CDS:1 n=1 Tax=Ambispora gerdemannii TaxID=144530 RepID=A0A9N8VPX3_9GLOM|nr:4354_t:CDS:2 [Ambispora gerdemannii]
MSTSLDMSLDEIIAKKRPSRAGRSGGPARGGGVTKRSNGPIRTLRSSQTRPRPYAGTSVTTSASLNATTEGKILVSNLAYKVTENDLWARESDEFLNVLVPKLLGLRSIISLNQSDLCTNFYRQRPFSSPCCFWKVRHVPHRSQLVAPIENNQPTCKSYTRSFSTKHVIDIPYPFSLQELFTSMIGPVRQVNLNFDQNGRSKGTASVVFNRRTDAVKAVEKFRNTTLDAPNAGPITQRIGGLNENRPTVRGVGGTRGSTARGGRSTRGGTRRSDNRAKPTQEQLDAEMSEYMQIDEDSTQVTDSTAIQISQ